MKTLLLFFVTALGFAQTDVTSILNAQLPGEPGVLFLGCCDDGLSPDGTNTDLCVWQEYVAYGDIELHRSRLVLRNCSLTIIDGNFITNNIEIEYTCDAELIFEGSGRLVMTADELNTLNIDEFVENCDFCVEKYYNLLGQLVNFDTANVGVYIQQTLKNGLVVKSKKIVKR